MLKTKTIKTIHKNVAVSAVAMLFIAASIQVMPTAAQSIQDIKQQINSLTSNIEHSENRIQQLQKRKNTLQNRLNILNAESKHIQAQINVTEKEIDQTKSEIQRKQAELERLKSLVQENVKVLYKHGDPSMLEILFSSDNFSDFISKEEYLSNAKEGMEKAAAEAIIIKEELETKKADLGIKAKELDSQRNALAIKQSEQRKLIAETRGEEARYQSKVASNEKALKEANEQLQAELARITVSYTGGVDFSGASYPYANACGNPYPPPHLVSTPQFPCAAPAEMGGYPHRQCTSYAFWRRGNMGRSVPGYWGNGGQWASSAANAGYEVNYTPKKGAIGVMGGASYGHVFIVEEVINGGQAVVASQYNVPNEQTNLQYGGYSVVQYNDLSGIQFIH